MSCVGFSREPGASVAESKFATLFGANSKANLESKTTLELDYYLVS